MEQPVKTSAHPCHLQQPCSSPWGPSDGSSRLEDRGRATSGIILKVERSLSLASVSHHRPAVMLRGGFLGNDTAAEPTLCEPSIRAFLLFLDLQGVLRRVTRTGCRWGGGVLRSGWVTGPFLSLLPGHAADAQRGASRPGRSVVREAPIGPSRLPVLSRPAWPEPVSSQPCGVTEHHQPAGVNVVQNLAATFPPTASHPDCR